jgi:hypothetical protein
MYMALFSVKGVGTKGVLVFLYVAYKSDQAGPLVEAT